MRTGASSRRWSRSPSATMPIDLVTLKEELARTGELDEVGGPAYIASLTDGVPRSANVEYYARIVKEKSTLRQLIQSANEFWPRRTTPNRTPTFCSTRRSARFSRSPRTGCASGFVPLRDLVQSSFATIEKLQQQQGARHRRADRIRRPRRDDVGASSRRISSSSRRVPRWARRASC